MALNLVELSFCRHATQELLACPLRYAFASPVDPKADWAADYFRIITHPMDLSTVMSRLNSNNCHSVSEWYADLNLIWQNAMTFNPRLSSLFSIADSLQKKCEKKFSKIPHSQADLLMLKLDHAHRQLGKLVAFDLPTYSLAPRVSPETLQYHPKSAH
jgi:hypothetical protein